MGKNYISERAQMLYNDITREIDHLAKRHQALIRRSKITNKKTRFLAETYVCLIDALTILRRGVVVDLIANKSDTISVRWVDELFHATAFKDERLMKSSRLKSIVRCLHRVSYVGDHRPIPIKVVNM